MTLPPPLLLPPSALSYHRRRGTFLGWDGMGWDGFGTVLQPAGFVLLVSGLQVGGKHDPLLVSLLVDFVAGYLGGAEDQESTSARCGMVIVWYGVWYMVYGMVWYCAKGGNCSGQGLG